MVDVRLLDELAARATTAGTVQLIDGWMLRAAPEIPFRRANAVAPFAGTGSVVDIAARIDTVEAFYRARGLPPRFQLSPASEPDDLDGRLAARGYVIEAPVDICVAPSDQVFGRGFAESAAEVRVMPTIDVKTIEAFGELRSRLDGYRRLLGAIAPRSTAAVAEKDGRPVAIGFGVLDRGWVGIFGMATRSDARRRGRARAVLDALAGWAMTAGARQLYLQVEIDNAPARKLYESAGFVRNHGYHYRVLA